VPDECDPDCNTTGTPDTCETITDCNANDVPDECEIGQYDCNTNGQIDSCEAGFGDCNTNGLHDPCELAAGTEYANRLYWTEDTGTSGNTVKRIDLDPLGTPVVMYDAADGVNQPSGIALDAVAAKVYWTEWGSDRIRRSNLNGTDTPVDLLTTGLTQPYSIDLDLLNGQMYWADAIGTNAIRHANLNGTDVMTVWSMRGDNRDGPHGVALDATNNKMYWTHGRDNKIMRANLDGNGVEPQFIMLDAGSRPVGIALDLVHNKVYWTEYNDDTIGVANLDGSGVDDAFVTGLADPDHVAVDPYAGYVYWTEYSAGKIKRKNLDSGIITTVVDVGAGVHPSGIAVIPEINVLDCNTNGTLDVCDAAAEDCNSNSVPDDCEDDCNTNGTADDCETGNDCDDNGTPDECELAENDCNTNDLLDACENSADCNSNEIPDECDLTIVDCNTNGVCDLCEVDAADCNTNGLVDACEVAAGPLANRIYWAEDTTGNRVVYANLTTGDDPITLHDADTNGVNRAFGVAIDLQGERLYWSEYGVKRIRWSGLDGGAATTLVDGTDDGNGIYDSTLSQPYSLALDLVYDKLYYADASGSHTIKVVNVDGSGPRETLWTMTENGLDGPFGVALDVANQKLYWTHARDGVIYRKDLGSGDVNTNFIDTGEDADTRPVGIALDLVNGKLYWTDYDDAGNGNGSIGAANIDGTGVQVGLITGLSSPDHVAVDPYANRIYWTEYFGSKIRYADLNSPNLKVDHVTGLTHPTGLALIPDIGVGDCDTNSVPDECDLLTADCNENGVPDDCDDCEAFEPGDCNFDCCIDGDDIQPFVGTLFGQGYLCTADIDDDDDVTVDDVPLFADLLLTVNPTCGGSGQGFSAPQGGESSSESSESAPPPDDSPSPLQDEVDTVLEWMELNPYDPESGQTMTEYIDDLVAVMIEVGLLPEDTDG